MITITFSSKAQEDWEYWHKNSPTIANRIILLLRDIYEHPQSGIGGPERLKYELSGNWSRRIDSEHRVIYAINERESDIFIISLRYHYSKK